MKKSSLSSEVEYQPANGDFCSGTRTAFRFRWIRDESGCGLSLRTMRALQKRQLLLYFANQSFYCCARYYFKIIKILFFNNQIIMKLKIIQLIIFWGLILGNELRGEDSYISQYQGRRLYSWDGQYLSKYQGSRLFEWDGEYLSAYQGRRLFERDGEYLSEYQGRRILELDGRYISQYQGRRLFEWDGEYLSRYQGARIFEVQGSIPLPILALLATGML